MTATDGPCILRRLPEPMRPIAAAMAVRERPDNHLGYEPHQPLSLGIIARKTWERGRRIGVALYNPTAQQRREAFDWLAAGWAASCSLSFFEAAWPEADLRFTLNPGGGNWHYLGTDCKMFLGQPTGNIGQWLRGTWLHEVGHALGFPHNMALPNYPLTPDYGYLIPWARQTQGWTEQQLRAQYAKEPEDGVRYSLVNDLKSVMQYWQEPAWNLQRAAVPPADDLSAEDRRFVGLPEVYGPAAVPPVAPPAPPAPPPVEVHPPVPGADGAVAVLRWGKVELLAYRSGTVVRAVCAVPAAGDVTVKVKDLEPQGSPIVDVLPSGEVSPVRLGSRPGRSKDVVLFPFTASGAGDHEFRFQFRGTSPSNFQAQVVKG